MLRSLNTRECFVATLVHNTLIYFIRKQNGSKVCVEKHKNKTKAKLVYLYLFLILAFMCSPSFIHFILSYIRVIKLRKKATGYKKSIREFI